MEQLWQDVRFGARMLRRWPAVTAAALLALSLGTGVNTALFSIVHAVLLRSLPFPAASELVQIWRTEPPDLEFGSASYPRYVDWRARGTAAAFEEMGAYSPFGLTLTGRDAPERLAGARASASFFRTLAAAPALGRWFADEDDRPGAPRVVVLSDALWRRRFGASPAVLDTSITLNGEPHTVVGVASPGLEEAWRFEAWVPLSLAVDDAQRGSNFLMVLARLRDGVSLDQARLQMAEVARGLSRDYPRDRYGFNILALHDVITRNARRALWALFAATGLVLLIACANVANLLLGLSLSRRREIAVRASLGAGRIRLLRQLLTETIVLGLAGTTLGWGLATLVLRGFALLAPANFPRLATVGLDGRVLLVSAAIAVAAGVLAGVLPALHVTRVQPNDALRDSDARGATAGGARRVGRGLVVAEVALAVVLMVAGGLTLRSLQHILDEDLGIRPEGVLTFTISLPESAAGDDGVGERSLRLVRDIEARIAALHAASRVGAINMLPIAATGMNGQVHRRDRPLPPEQAPIAEFRVVTPGYFATLDVRAIAGRLPDARDREEMPLVVVINETLARTLWPGQPPDAALGSLIRTGFDDEQTWREVIGVTRDVRSRRPEAPPDAETYVPHAQVPVSSMAFTVTTSGPPDALVPAIRRELAQLNPDLPMSSIRTMSEVLATATRGSRLYSALAALLAALAALLAVVGIYSVMSYSIAQRRRELAIRAALGASSQGLLRMVLREGFLVSTAGIAIGLAVAPGAAKLLGSLLYRVDPADPLVHAAAAAVVTGAAAAGYLLPAARASRVRPIEALRES